MSSTSDLITPLATLVLGWALKAAGDWLGDSRTSKRERATRREGRRDQLAVRRSDFQRTTLLELQVACRKLARNAGQTHVHDERTFRERGQWVRALLPEDLNEEITTNISTIVMLTARVRDETVRELAEEFRKTCGDLTFAESSDESYHRLQVGMDTDRRLNERIGEVLRTLEDDDFATAED